MSYPPATVIVDRVAQRMRTEAGIPTPMPRRTESLAGALPRDNPLGSTPAGPLGKARRGWGVRLASRLHHPRPAQVKDGSAHGPGPGGESQEMPGTWHVQQAFLPRARECQANRRFRWHVGPIGHTETMAAARPPRDVLWPLPEGGNWEGGTADAEGNRWVHVPWTGWEMARPSPFLVATRRRSWLARILDRKTRR